LKKRVVVTGVGIVSPIGIGKEAFWPNLLKGKSGVGLVTHFDASSYPCKIAAEVNDFDSLDFFSPKSSRRFSRGTQFAIVATQKAVEDAQIDLKKEDPYRLGLSYGTALGPMDIYEKFGATFYERGLKRVNPSFLAIMNHNAMIGGLAQVFGIHGYNLAVAAGCSAGNVAVANGFFAISSGQAELLICGGVDTPIYPLTFGLYAASNSLASYNGDPTKAMCPYDKRRNGFVLGEGAGTLILEEIEHAQRRNARVYAEILGCSLTNDANNLAISSPETEHAIKAYHIALSQAELKAEDVDYICGHAHSSVMLDKKETDIVKKVFGDHAYRLAMSAIKAMVGHSMGGGTAMQSITASLALHEGMLPPTINYENPDPECDLDYVPNRYKRKDIRVAMVNSFGLGGTNVVIAFKKPENAPF